MNSSLLRSSDEISTRSNLKRSLRHSFTLNQCFSPQSPTLNKSVNLMASSLEFDPDKSEDFELQEHFDASQLLNTMLLRGKTDGFNGKSKVTIVPMRRDKLITAIYSVNDRTFKLNKPVIHRER